MFSIASLCVGFLCYGDDSIRDCYDELSRLKSSTHNTDEQVYTHGYDVAGNRLSELLSGTQVTNVNRYFGYNSANQLIAEGDTLDGNGDVIADYTFEYDNNGNLRYKKDTVPTTLETPTHGTEPTAYSP